MIVSDLPKTRSGKVSCSLGNNRLFNVFLDQIMRKIVAGEGDQLGDLSTLAESSVVEVIEKKVVDSK
jgi:acetyl-CoA synthetase